MPANSRKQIEVTSVPMVNLLGTNDINDFIMNYDKALVEFPDAKVHTYGKSARTGRKMGHVTVLGSDAKKTLDYAQAAAEVLRS